MSAREEGAVRGLGARLAPVLARWGGAGEGGRGPGAQPAGSGAKGQAEGSARGAGAAARVTRAGPSLPQLGARGPGLTRAVPRCLHFSGRRRGLG